MYNVGVTTAEAVDNVFIFIVAISVVLLVLVTALMIFFAVKYNKNRHPQPKPVKQNVWLEVVWTLIPTILVLAMFFYGYEGFKVLRDVPEDAMVVKVTGRMWNWSFEYDNGKTTDKLYVPVGKSVKLLLKSVDVIHSFYIPAFRVKEDVVPGQETYMWFKPQAIGPSDIFCAEFCGQRHAFMLSQVISMKQEEFDQWYQSTPGTGEPVDPAIPIMEEFGCLDCHSLDDSADERLSLKGLLGATRIVIADGEEKLVVVDDAYLRRSITDPSAEVVKGQDDSMEAPEDITKEQLDEIIRFLKGEKKKKEENPKEQK